MTGEGGDLLQGQGFGAGAWAGWGPENPREWDEGGEPGGKEPELAKSPDREARKPTRGSAPFPCRVYFEIGSTTTTLTIRRATPQDSGKYEVFVENSLGMDQSFARVDVA